MAEYYYSSKDILDKAIGTDAYFQIKSILTSTKAADVAPVVHGEWIVCGDGDNVPWMCSHCGRTTASKYKIAYGKYCPNCGAKMDQEETHAD